MQGIFTTIFMVQVFFFFSTCLFSHPANAQKQTRQTSAKSDFIGTGKQSVNSEQTPSTRASPVQKPLCKPSGFPQSGCFAITAELTCLSMSWGSQHFGHFLSHLGVAKSFSLVFFVNRGAVCSYGFERKTNGQVLRWY